MIAVDTSVLSLALRRVSGRHPVHPAARRLRSAIEEGVAVVVPGVCVQEILSGVRDARQFDRLTSLLAPLPVLLATRGDHVGAARLANVCRSAGVAVGTVDALVAALAIERGASLLTTDGDFVRIARHSTLRLEAYG